ncbi:MAG: hypothetical protein FWD59_06835 [Micrococcales bacterium]|nr:hypothetical protein [Micrococcales bacterium]
MTAAPVRHASSHGDVDGLVAHLLDPERSRPVAVISCPFDVDEPWIDVQRIHEDVGDLVDVWVLTDKRATWYFSDGMPELTQVYGGAGRVYPADTTWQTDPYASPLHLVMTPAEGKRSTVRMISDALTMAVAAGLVAPSTPSAAMTSHTGEVMGTVGTRAFVRLESGETATIWSELTVPGVDIDAILAKGQTVSGLLDSNSRRLDIRPSLVQRDDAVAAYRPGDVVLARVEKVGASWVVVLPFPELSVRVPSQFVTDDPAEDLTDLFTTGEVVRARVGALNPLRLRMDDVGPSDEPIPAPSILPGGPPWITRPKPRPKPVPEPVLAQARDDGRPTPLALAARVGGGVSHPGLERARVAVATRAAEARAAAEAAAAAKAKEAEEAAAQARAEAAALEEAERARRRAMIPKPGPPGMKRPSALKPGPRPGPVPGRPTAPSSVEGESGIPGAEGALGIPTVDGVSTATVVAGEEAAAKPTTPAVPEGPKPITPTKSEPTASELHNLVAVWENRAKIEADRNTSLRQDLEDDRRALEAQRNQLDEAAREKNRLQNQVGELRTRLREAQSEGRKWKRTSEARDESGDGVADIVADRFADPVEQLRWEVYVDWVTRFGPAEKAGHPLPPPEEWGVGPRYIESIDTLQGVDRGKVVSVMVEVLTKLAEQLPGRKLHQLRTSSGGGTEARTTAEGATMWRAAIQRGSPGARALHYARKGKFIEFDQVGVHDDALL